jgi:hypothetical protein
MPFVGLRAAGERQLLYQFIDRKRFVIFFERVIQLLVI